MRADLNLSPSVRDQRRRAPWVKNKLSSRRALCARACASICSLFPFLAAPVAPDGPWRANTAAKLAGFVCVTNKAQGRQQTALPALGSADLRPVAFGAKRARKIVAVCPKLYGAGEALAGAEPRRLGTPAHSWSPQIKACARISRRAWAGRSRVVKLCWRAHAPSELHAHQAIKRSGARASWPA